MGEVVCTTDALEERFNQAVISFNNVTNELEIIKGNVNSRKIRFSFKETDAEKNFKIIKRLTYVFLYSSQR